MTDDHARGEGAEITWSYINSGPRGPDGSRRETLLACKPNPPLLEGVPVGALVGGFGVSARSKRFNSNLELRHPHSMQA